MEPLLGAALLLIVYLAVLASTRSEWGILLRLVSRVCALRDQGKPDAAAEVALQAIAAGRTFPWLINLAVEALISAGRYSEALAIPSKVPDAGPADATNPLLVQINLAEAEYNLGRWDAAWDRLRTLDEAAGDLAITAAGLAQQRAWILIHTGRPAEALSSWEQADIDGLPYRYHAEHHFTHAAVLLALGRFEEAEDAALAGADAAVRASSVRNSFFVRARVAAARGDWTQAESFCRAAAAHFYRGQGGDGLLLWGDTLLRLGRPDEARQAYELSISRDGQSESARTAAARLQAMDAPASKAS